MANGLLKMGEPEETQTQLHCQVIRSVHFNGIIRRLMPLSLATVAVG